jgi:hypothetical protein
MDATTATAWGKLQRAMRAGPPPPPPRQAEMFYPWHRNDVRALKMAAQSQDRWTPPRGLAAAARRLCKAGMLAKADGAYRVTADGLAASRGGAAACWCLERR